MIETAFSQWEKGPSFFLFITFVFFKPQVKKYWTEKQRKWKEQEAKDLLRLAEFKKLMAEQVLRDKER